MVAEKQRFLLPQAATERPLSLHVGSRWEGAGLHPSLNPMPSSALAASYAHRPTHLLPSPLRSSVSHIIKDGAFLKRDWKGTRRSCRVRIEK